MNILTYATGRTVTQGNTITSGTNDSTKIGPYALEGVQTSAVTVSDKPYGLYFNDPTISKIWVSFYMHIPANATSWYESEGITFSYKNPSTGEMTDIAKLNTLTNERMWIFASMESFGGGWTEVKEINTSWAINNLYRMDIELDSANGTIRVFRDGLVIANESLPSNGGAWCNYVDFNHMFGSTSYSVTYSSMFIADSDTRNTIMNQHSITSNGPDTDWSGSVFDICALPPDGCDSSCISTTEANQMSSFGISPAPTEFEGDYKVVACGIQSRSRIADGSEVETLKMYVDNNGTDYETDALSTRPNGLQSAYFSDPKILYPGTEGSITPANINSLKVGIKTV